MKGSIMSPEHVRDVVREKYGQAALRAKTGAASSCCGSAAAVEPCCDPITSNLYDAGQEGEVPDLALRASLGCGIWAVSHFKRKAATCSW